MILDDFKLDGRVALVTGARAGLGCAAAEALAEAGADVVGVGRGAMREIRDRVESLGRRFLEIHADLSSTKPIPGIIEKTVDEFGRLDILVNNAGATRRAPAIEYSEKDWDYVLNVNLKSVFFLCQGAARQFSSQGSGGKIINIASLLSFQGGILVAPYTASKSGVAGLTRLLANEWAADGVNVNAIAPGYMLTDMTRPLKEDPDRNPAIIERIPAKRWGVPSDLKGTIVFLASTASNYLNGCTIAVDGGWLAR